MSMANEFARNIDDTLNIRLIKNWIKQYFATITYSGKVAYYKMWIYRHGG